MNFLCSGRPEVNNQPHGEELCKNPVVVHAFCTQPENIRLKKSQAEKRFIYDTGFHLDLESNNADCGDLIDLMKPEREPSTILCFGNVTCQRQRFSGPPLCQANIDLESRGQGEPFAS